MQPVAPSLSPAALPAVTLPCGAERRLQPGEALHASCPGAAARPASPGRSPSRRTGSPSAPGRAGTARRRTPRRPSRWLRDGVRVGALLGDVRVAVVQVLRGHAHDERGAVDELLGQEPRVGVDALAHRVAAHVLDAARDGDVVGAEGDAARRPWSPRSSRPRTCGRSAYPGTLLGSPASTAAERPMVRPWSPIWVVAAMATSSIRSAGSDGLRRHSSRITRTTRSSARVSAYRPFGPALPNGVRTPSTKTTSRAVRGTVGPRCWIASPLCYSPVTTLDATRCPDRSRDGTDRKVDCFPQACADLGPRLAGVLRMREESISGSFGKRFPGGFLWPRSRMSPGTRASRSPRRRGCSTGAPGRWEPRCATRWSWPPPSSATAQRGRADPGQGGQQRDRAGRARPHRPLLRRSRRRSHAGGREPARPDGHGRHHAIATPNGRSPSSRR